MRRTPSLRSANFPAVLSSNARLPMAHSSRHTLLTFPINTDNVLTAYPQGHTSRDIAPPFQDPSAFTFHYLNSTVVTNSIALRMSAARRGALQSTRTLYLPASGLVDRVQWIEDGVTLRLVKQEDVACATPHSAILSSIMYFTEVGFSRLEDGAATRSTRSKPCKPRLRLTVTGVAPADQDLTNDFKFALLNLDRIMRSIPTPAQTKSGVIVNYFWDKRIQFSHVPLLASSFCFIALTSDLTVPFFAESFCARHLLLQRKRCHFIWHIILLSISCLPERTWSQIMSIF